MDNINRDSNCVRDVKYSNYNLVGYIYIYTYYS